MNDGWNGFEPEGAEPSKSEYRRERREEKRLRRKENGHGSGKIAALCVCCVLLGGILSGAAFYGLSSLEEGRLAGLTGLPALQGLPRAADGAAQPSEDTASVPDGESAPQGAVAPGDAAASGDAPDAPDISAGGLVSSAAPATVKTYTASNSATLTATDIYYNYAAAVVGVTTELTASTNVFGQVSSATVSGTGFVISKDGYILTNAHVVEGASTVTVTDLAGDTFPAVIIGYDSDYEVGVLKIEAENELDCVALGSIDDVLVGEDVYVIGNPLGELTYSITPGIISALDRDINIDGTAINAFQISAAVNSGNSGGPVFSTAGSVVGIVTAKSSGIGVEGLGFAITIDDALTVAQDLITNGYVTGKPYFGINVSNIDSAIVSYYNLPDGVYVESVETGSCADTAGVEQGDIITGLGGYETPSREALSSAKKKFSAGDQTELTVYRNGETLTLTLVFDEEPLPAR